MVFCFGNHFLLKSILAESDVQRDKLLGDEFLVLPSMHTDSKKEVSSLLSSHISLDDDCGVPRNRDESSGVANLIIFSVCNPRPCTLF